MTTSVPTEAQWFETIGRATHNSAVIDLILMNCLRVTCDLTLKQAQAIYYSPDAFQTRVKIVRNLFKANGVHVVAKQIVNDVILLGEMANRKRNELAHSFMTLAGGKPARMNLRNMDQPSVPMTSTYLESALLPTRNAVASARVKYKSLCDLLGVPPQLQH